MAVPASLKQKDANIYKTAMRAEQLQSVKPVIAYWCNYWVLKQIIERDKDRDEDLRKASPEIDEYSMVLMDRLEDAKREHASEDAITDDTAAQLYVEQFAQETLDRAQRVVNANKVTATTANTFDAAATFFGLANIWGTPDAETLQKIKYAKWNATRILKAFKEGTDPNDSNPKPDDLPQHDDVSSADGALSPGSVLPGGPASAPRPVTIEDDPEDSGSLRPAEQHGVSLPHSPASSAGGTGGTGNHATAAPGSPPLQDPDHLPSAPSHDADVPSFVDDVSPTLPSLTPGTAPTGMFDSPPLSLPSAPPAPSAPHSHQQLPPVLPPTFAPSPHPTAAAAPSAPPATYPSYGAPPQQAYTPPTGYPPATGYNNTAPQHSAPPAAYAQPPPALPPNTNVDDAALAAAQKHAKWAISALNFEDVSTAVRELRKALQQLGAS